MTSAADPASEYGDPDGALPALLDSLPLPVMCVRRQTDAPVLHVNRPFVELFGDTRSGLPGTANGSGLAFADLARQPGGALPWAAALDAAFPVGAQVPPIEASVRSQCGSERVVVINTAVLAQVLLVSFTDITQQKLAEQDLRRSEERYRILAENARDTIWTIGLDGTVTYVSPAVEVVRGFTPEEAMRQTLEETLMPPSQAKVTQYFGRLAAAVQASLPVEDFVGELEYRCKDGSTFWTEVRACLLRDASGVPLEILGMSRDIAERKRNELDVLRAREAAERANQALELANLELKRLATTDPLTGAWNRRHFEEVVAAELSRSRRHAQPLTLLLFDLDHFKSINDGHGHPTGDRVLVDVVQRVRLLLRREDVLARWGGEEFIVLVPHARAHEGALLADRLRGALAQQPFPEVGPVTASFGVAEFQPDEPFDACVRRADAALYQAKRQGRNGVAEAEPA